LRQMRNSQTNWLQFDSDWRDSASVTGDLMEDSKHVVHQLTRRYLGYWPWRWWDSYEEELFLDRTWQAGVDTARKLQRHEPYVSARRLTEESTRALKVAFPNASTRFVLADWQEDMGEKFLNRVITAQVQRDMMIAGIALHRYRLRHGKWPGTLDELVPQFLKAPPLDVIDGKPLRYESTGKSGESFVLYSIGKDMEDNNGDATCSSRKPNVWTGKDWVWPQPATSTEAAAYWQKNSK